MSRRLQAMIWVAVASFVLLGQAVLPVTVDSMLWNAVLDAGHLVLFAGFAIVVLVGLGSSADDTSRRRLCRYGVALAAVVIMAGLSEFIQKFGERNAESTDFVRDLLGGGAALCVAASIDAGIGLKSAKLRWVLTLAALALLAFGLNTVFRMFQDYRQRDQAFPVVCDFGSAWTETFLDSRNLQWEVVSTPRAWSTTANKLVARLTFAVAEYPGLMVREPFPDWTGYDRLEFEIYSAAQVPRQMAIRLNDSRHDNRYSDRFNRALTVSPGINRFSIPLAEVRNAPQGRTMDMQSISAIAVFAISPQDTFSVYLGGLRLSHD